MSLVTLVLKSLEGSVKVLERDIENASNKIVALDKSTAKSEYKREELVQYYEALISEAKSNHEKVVLDNTAKISTAATRRAVSTKLKIAISKLINGDV